MAFAWATFGVEAAGPAGVRRRHVREEDEHVHRYMAAMDDVRFSTTWQVLWADDRRYEPVMVPSLWVSTARAPGTASGLDSSVVHDLY